MRGINIARVWKEDKKITDSKGIVAIGYDNKMSVCVQQKLRQTRLRLNTSGIVFLKINLIYVHLQSLKPNNKTAKCVIYGNRPCRKSYYIGREPISHPLFNLIRYVILFHCSSCHHLFCSNSEGCIRQLDISTTNGIRPHRRATAVDTKSKVDL